MHKSKYIKMLMIILASITLNSFCNHTKSLNQMKNGKVCLKTNSITQLPATAKEIQKVKANCLIERVSLIIID